MPFVFIPHFIMPILKIRVRDKKGDIFPQFKIQNSTFKIINVPTKKADIPADLFP